MNTRNHAPGAVFPKNIFGLGVVMVIVMLLGALAIRNQNQKPAPNNVPAAYTEGVRQNMT